MAEKFKDGKFPEPPLDENGNPIAPPERPPFPPHGGPKGKRPEPPKGEDGKPTAHPFGKKPDEEAPEAADAPEAEAAPEAAK